MLALECGSNQRL